MRIFYDFEFLERRVRVWPTGRRVHTIEPISIGMVAEDGRELYAVNRNMPVRAIRRHPWLMANVVPGLPKGHGDQRMSMPSRWLFHYADRAVQPREEIAARVRTFINSTPDPQLWAWYGAYDHVSLAWLFGPMSQLPEGIPMWTNDLRQECERLGNPLLPEQESGVHNALADARHNLARARVLDDLAAKEH